MLKEIILRLYLKPSTAQLFENRSQHCQPYPTPPHCGRRSHRRPRDRVPSPHAAPHPVSHRSCLPGQLTVLLGNGYRRPPSVSEAACGPPPACLSGHQAVISLIFTALTCCWACARPPLTTRQPALCLRVTNPLQPPCLPHKLPRLPHPAVPHPAVPQRSPLCPVCRSPRQSPSKPGSAP